MKFALLLSLVILCACEAKKSTGTIGKVAPRQTSSTLSQPEVVIPHVNSNVTSSNKSACDNLTIDIDLITENGAAITQDELLTNTRGSMELKSITSVLTDRGGMVRLIETRVGNGYVQSCKEMTGIAPFNISYAVAKNFSLRDGRVDRRNNLTFRAEYDPARNEGRVDAFKVTMRDGAHILSDFLEPLARTAGTQTRIYRAGNIVEFKIRSEMDTLGLVISHVMRYEARR